MPRQWELEVKPHPPYVAGRYYRVRVLAVSKSRKAQGLAVELDHQEGDQQGRRVHALLPTFPPSDQRWTKVAQPLQREQPRRKGHGDIVRRNQRRPVHGTQVGPNVHKHKIGPNRRSRPVDDSVESGRNAKRGRVLVQAAWPAV